MAEYICRDFVYYAAVDTVDFYNVKVLLILEVIIMIQIL